MRLWAIGKGKEAAAILYHPHASILGRKSASPGECANKCGNFFLNNTLNYCIDKNILNLSTSFSKMLLLEYVLQTY